ncbi:MAG TPA: M13 family metallopeptidase N-terminal domain-containing protein, partial [Sphingomicrobium sp.]|nr:M13 family metallopeptidase N-terminal domain-containing protein [Sphingomicrobium sp.]
MKRLVILLAATTALAGCTASPPPEVMAPAAPAEAPPAPAPAPKPELGTFGFDTAGMDRSVQPGDNFYMFSNGTWARNTPIPADKSNYGMFTRLDDLSKERTRVIIEEAAKDPNSKIGNAYNSYLDTAAIEAKGLAPIQPWLGEIKGLSNRSGYAALAAKAGRLGVGIPFGLYVGQDDKSPDRYVTQMFQSGIGMPDRDYYLLQDERMKGVRAKYLEHLTNVLTLAGEPNAAVRAKALLDFETEIAKVHWTQVDSRDATKTYNLMPLARVQADAKGFDWATFLRDS